MATPYDYFQNVIYQCVIGSRAYGLDDADSDVDRRGFYLPPADKQWSLAGVPEQLEKTIGDEVYWEAEKFVRLVLKANPLALESLYTPLVEHMTPLAGELIALRPRLLSRRIFHTYGGFAASQHRKLQNEFIAKGTVKWKYVMHMLRLLLAGATALERGVLTLNVGEDGERLLAIRRGEISMDECNAWRVELQARLDRAAIISPLPEQPDIPAANDWLLRARRSMI